MRQRSPAPETIAFPGFSLSELARRHLCGRWLWHQPRKWTDEWGPVSSPQPRVLTLELLEAFGLADLEPAVLFAPAVVSDLVDAQRPDHLRDLLALAEQYLCLTQLGDDLLGG
jgi:hypothetical protein